MKFGLEENIIEEITRVLEEQPKVEKAYIFGSRAKGNYRPDSDIDIALKGYDLTVEDILKISAAIDKQNLGYEVDWVDYKNVKEQALREHIDRIGIPLYDDKIDYKIEDLAIFLNEKRVPLSSMERNKKKGIYPYYGASGIVDYIDEYVFNGEYVLISEDGENLKTRQTPIAFIATGKFWVNNHAHIVKGNKSFINKLLVYCFENLDLTPYLTGAVQPKLNKSTLASIPIRIPKRESDQIAIVNTLGSLDDKIDLLHRQNKTLESMSDTLFRQWFVEEAKEDWEEKTLDECIFFDPREKINRNVLRQFFEMKCLSNTDMNIAQSELRMVTSGSVFRNGDTLLAKITPCLENGKTGFVMQLDDNEVAMGSTEFIVMRSRGSVSPYWIYCLARSEDFRDNAILSMTGTSGRQRVQLGLLKSIKVKVNNSVMKSFHQMILPIFAKIKSNQNQIHSLVALRDTLLPKLLSGEARVKMP